MTLRAPRHVPPVPALLPVQGGPRPCGQDDELAQRSGLAESSMCRGFAAESEGPPTKTAGQVAGFLQRRNRQLFTFVEPCNVGIEAVAKFDGGRAQMERHIAWQPTLQLRPVAGQPALPYLAAKQDSTSTMFAIDTPALSRAAAAERWRNLAAVMPEDGRPETDQYGQLLLAPLPANRQQRVAGVIAQQLREQLGGLAWAGVAINTRIGVRVPDVCWSDTPERFDEDPAPTAPEICVEVASPGNTAKWLLEKAAAYLEAGAREAIIVEVDGRIRFYDAGGERAGSAFGLVLNLPG